MIARCLENFAEEEYLDLDAHIRHHVEETDGEASAFEFGLDALLDGLERIRGGG